MIVEGFGQVEAVPILIRRWLEARGAAPPEILRPIRIPKHRLISEGELERAIEQAARHVGPQGKILVLIDADDDCAKRLASELLDRARRARPDRDVAVVLPVREFEAWFIAAAESLRGHRGLADDLQPPDDAEAVRDAKGWLTARMTGERRYAPTRDQASLAHAVDLDVLQERSRSFRKLTKDLERLAADHETPNL